MRKLLSFVFSAILLIAILPITKTHAANVTGNDIVKIANQYIGVPYKWGGNTPAGFDCSGFLVYVFDQAGISLPRTADDQYNKVGKAVEKSDLKIGDLVFFSGTYDKKGITHSGIYVGNNNFISATNSGVLVASLDNSYWKSKYTGAKRVLNEEVLVVYTDLNKDHFAYTAVGTLGAQCIISGYTDGTFRPQDSVTR